MTDYEGRQDDYFLYDMIELLKRVQRCQKALFSLRDLSNHRLFEKGQLPAPYDKYAEYVHSQLLEMIKNIKWPE